jgi:hypothetical protein
MMANRWMLRTALFVLSCMFAAMVSAAAPKQPVHVLFVGNSLTYVGNLPAVLEALATDNGKSLQADMLVKGGATLTEWLESGAVQRVLNARHYDYVVLQERGNDFACGFGPQVCKDARHALHAADPHGNLSGQSRCFGSTRCGGIEGSPCRRRALSCRLEAPEYGPRTRSVRRLVCQGRPSRA